MTLEATARAARDASEVEIARAKAQLKVSLLSALETPGGPHRAQRPPDPGLGAG